MTDLFEPQPTPPDSQPAVVEEKKPDESNIRLLGPFFELLETLALALILYFAVDAVLARVIVENISMEPTLYPNNFVLVNKLAYRLGSEPRTGEIVIFHNPQDLSVDYIKRVIGAPGDTVRVADGTVYVNGSALVEPYISAPPDYYGEWVVPKDEIFVLGDNRNHSSDSHEWGFVPMKDVVGKALLIYWPLESFKVIGHPEVLASPAQ